MSVRKLLSVLQKQLKAPKGQYNSFGKYNFRSCEDIVEAVKKLLGEGESLVMTDDIVLVGDRIYVKATVTLKNEDGEVSTTGFAREPETRKGMDAAQVTGTSSSYARKYALNGLFAIDDTKDSDTDEFRTEVHNRQGERDSGQDEADPGEYVMPVGFKGIKGEKLKNIDQEKLHSTFEYWSKNAKNGIAKEAVAAMKLYLNEQG